jgi:RNA polymerase sigma factor (sigma-70 family)
VDDEQWLAGRFEQHRPRLRAVAYRMLGSLTEADDAVQDAWLRLSRSGAGDVENLGSWLTTVVARVCLNMLRSRGRRHEEPLAVHLPDPVIVADGELQPEDAAVLADSVGLALLVVLDTLSPDERLAFVLHDMFDLPFAQIATMIGRTPAAAKQLASRARRRVKGAAAPADPDLARQREVVNAFFAAARRGDFDALVAVLHPGVLLRIDPGTRIDAGARAGAAPSLVHGAAAVARQAVEGFRQAFGRPGAELHPVLVNGAAGVVVTLDGQPLTVMSFTIADGKVTGIDAISDPGRVRALATAVLPGGAPGD